MADTKNTKAFYNTEIPGDWSAPEFGDVFNFLKTFSFSREQLTSEITKDEIRNIHYGDIHSTYENEILDFEIEKTVPYLLDGIIEAKSFEYENFPALKEGDLIIADASEDYEGVCDCVELKNINGAKVVSGLHTFAARASEVKIALGYRTYALQHEQVIRELRRIATGTSVYGVSKTNLSKVKLPLPLLPEQKAIAQVLSTADAAIHTTEKLIAQKELRKKWLMQQLLTGKKRLKGFEGDWKKYRLEEVGVFFKGIGVSKIEIMETGLPAVRYGELYTKYHFLISEITTYIDEKSANLSKKIQKGDILFAGSGETNEEIGKCAAYIMEEVAYAGGDIIVFRPNNADSVFLGYLLNSAPVNSQKTSMGKGHSVVHIYPKDIATIDITIPVRKEQTAIAQVLQAADKEISLLKAKVDKLREQKKGLMQVLLTGKVRLKIDNK